MSPTDDDKSSFQTAESAADTFHTAGSGGESGPSLVRILSGAQGPIVDNATSAGVEAQAVVELAAYGLDRRRQGDLERSASRASSRRGGVEAKAGGVGEEKVDTRPEDDDGDGSANTVVNDDEPKDDEEVPPGLKGWLDLLGTVMANMLCCESTLLRGARHH